MKTVHIQNITSDLVMRYHDSISTEVFEKLPVSETETFSRNESYEILRQQTTRLVL